MGNLGCAPADVGATVRATARGLEEMDTRSCAPWLTVESLLVGEAGVVCACVPVALLAYKDGEDDLS
jgi:hypothetical protein